MPACLTRNRARRKRLSPGRVVGLPSAPGPFSDALRPLADRMARAVREHGILRVAGPVGEGSGDREAGAARDAVLEWAEDRVGDRLPEAAWEHDEFDRRHVTGAAGGPAKAARLRRRGASP